ncbi:unnamed protein product [Arabis nemorensis]|uniref:Uncharacterized protein n=1 Tax=Arabis nemorensis TaxID=586526 RepID=A0A565BFF2_9BRAS|nr:unnamed protein product [Arabis nemorensis]
MVLRLLTWIRWVEWTRLCRGCWGWMSCDAFGVVGLVLSPFCSGRDLAWSCSERIGLGLVLGGRVPLSVSPSRLWSWLKLASEGPW